MEAQRTRRVVALDTETTGFSPEHHRIVEVGAVEVDPRTGAVGRRFHEVLNPLQMIPWGATKVHGLRDADVRTKPHFGKLAPAIIDFVRGSTLAIHNSRFDVKMLDAELERHGFSKLEAFGVTVVDTLSLARELLPFLPSHKLDCVCDALGVDRSSRSKHGALLDAELLGQSLPRLAREYDASSARTGRCGHDAATAADDIAGLAREELERLDTRTPGSLEMSFCRIARVLTYARYCRLLLLGRWETELAIEQWSCAHFATLCKTSSAISNAMAAKALLAPEALARYRKQPATVRMVTAKTEYVLDPRFEILAARLAGEMRSPHSIAYQVLAIEASCAALDRARADLRGLIIEAAARRELMHVVISTQTRTAIDYPKALAELAPDADLVPFRTQAAPSRVFRARNLGTCSEFFGPPPSAANAA